MEITLELLGDSCCCGAGLTFTTSTVEVDKFAEATFFANDAPPATLKPSLPLELPSIALVFPSPESPFAFSGFIGVNRCYLYAIVCQYFSRVVPQTNGADTRI